MRTNFARRNFLKLAASSPVALAAGRLSAAGAGQDPAPTPNCPPPRRMGTIGLTRDQILRVSLFHHEEEAPQPCFFIIDVIGIGGQMLGQSAGQLFPGTGTFADFDLASGLNKGERGQCHIHVTIPSGHPVGATAEVFDAKTGATRYPSDPCESPTPFPLAMGMVGVARDQLVRISLFHDESQFPSDPCGYKIALRGIGGQTLGESAGMLQAGAGAFADFDLAAGLANGARVQFHADVFVPEDHLPMVGATVEIYDSKTGETQIPVDPCIMPLPTSGQG